MPVEAREHQVRTAQFWKQNERIFDHSDPGTGKTISALAGYIESIAGRLLVVAPLSILRPSWGQDIEKFCPAFNWAVAHGSEAKRRKAIDSRADIVLINHDGIKWLADNPKYLSGFSHCVVDEYTVFKHRSRQRSTAMCDVGKQIPYLSMLSGTPNSNRITDLWHPAYIVDSGKRLGNNFFKFQQEICSPRPIPGAPNPRAVEWVEKDGARDAVAKLLEDISIRHLLEDCTDIPEHTVTYMPVEMPASVMRHYRELEREALLILEAGTINAVHAGSKARKILQLLSGAAYDADGNVVKIHPHRYQLVMDLAAQREQCVVAFNFRHEREALAELAERAGFSFDVIDGNATPRQREDAVEKFQAGQLKLMLIHPQSGSHGLTLTSGTTTIWASPTYNAEHFQQLCRRIYRSGQTRKTETICIYAEGTKEQEVYDKLDGKISRMSDLLDIFARSTREAA